jgi:hypothetical protein
MASFIISVCSGNNGDPIRISAVTESKEPFGPQQFLDYFVSHLPKQILHESGINSDLLE